MLRITDRELASTALTVLAEIQADINAVPDYGLRVEAAKLAWNQKTSTQVKASAFRTIRQTLSQMCVGPVRCAYCEDSLADEVEHVRPKNLFPEVAFTWANYLFACGPCNGPKSNRYGTVEGELLNEFRRNRNDPIEPPPPGLAALIDPRSEDPLIFLDLDLGGVTPEGLHLAGTFDFMPADDLAPTDCRRAEFTIEVLGLNREVTRAARANAFGGFRARLREYAEEKGRGVTERRLQHVRDDLLRTPHLTVFAEMRRQQHLLPEIQGLFDLAPEALGWPLVPLLAA